MRAIRVQIFALKVHGSGEAKGAGESRNFGLGGLHKNQKNTLVLSVFFVQTIAICINSGIVLLLFIK